MDFIETFEPFGFSVMDESDGYNTSRYSGYLTSKHQFYECIIEIYHEGDMVFVEE